MKVVGSNTGGAAIYASSKSSGQSYPVSANSYAGFFDGGVHVNVVGALWCKYILPAVLLILMLIVVIEQIIHTVYTVTPDGILEISTGRFIRKKVIPISEITAIRKCHSMKFGRFSVTEYVLIEYGKGKFVSVMPVKEREFVELLEKRLTDYIL